MSAPTRSSDGARIFGQGPQIQLAGKTYHVRFGFKALQFLESRFGSVEAFITRLSQKEWGEDRLRSICLGVTAGVMHEKPAEMSIEEFEEFIVDALDGGPDGLIGWINTLAQAVSEQWPAPSARTRPKGQGSPRSSPGPRSTSSPRSRSAARKRSSRS